MSGRYGQIASDVKIAAYGKGLTSSQQKSLLNYGRKDTSEKKVAAKRSLDDLKKDLSEVVKEMQSQSMPPRSLLNRHYSLTEKIKKLEGSAKDSAKLATDPPVSEKQRRAMFAAKEGKSTLGIPKKVGEEFVGKDAETGEWEARVSKIVRGKRTLIASHKFKSEQAARDYARSYKGEYGYETSVKKTGSAQDSDLRSQASKLQKLNTEISAARQSGDQKRLAALMSQRKQMLDEMTSSRRTA